MEGALYAKMGHRLLPSVNLTPVMCLTLGMRTTRVKLPDANCQLLEQYTLKPYLFRLIVHLSIFTRHCHATLHKVTLHSLPHACRAASMCEMVCSVPKLQCMVLHAGWAAMPIRQRRLLKRGELICSAWGSTWGCNIVLPHSCCSFAEAPILTNLTVSELCIKCSKHADHHNNVYTLSPTIASC